MCFILYFLLFLVSFVAGRVMSPVCLLSLVSFLAVVVLTYCFESCVSGASHD